MSVEIVDGADDSAVAGWVAERLMIALERAGQAEIAIAVPAAPDHLGIVGELVRHSLAWSRVVVWPGAQATDPQADDQGGDPAEALRGPFAAAGARAARLQAQAVPPRFALAWIDMDEQGALAPAAGARASPLAMLPVPALLASDALMFVIRGGAKRHAFEAAVVGASDTPVAHLLASRSQPVTAFA